MLKSNKHRKVYKLIIIYSFFYNSC